MYKNMTLEEAVANNEPLLLEIEPEAELIHLPEGQLSAHRYINMDGLGNVGGATLLLNSIYAVYDKCWNFIAPTALALQVNVDARKKISTPQNTAEPSNPNKWFFNDEGMLCPDPTVPKLARGEDPTDPVQAKFKAALGGRSDADLRKWRTPNKRINAHNWKPVDLILEAESGDFGTTAALDLNGSAVHCSHNIAQSLWADEYSEKILSELELPDADASTDWDAEAFAQVGKALINKSLGDTVIKHSDLMTLNQYVNSQFCKAIKGYCRKVSRIVDHTAPDNDALESQQQKLHIAKQDLRNALANATDLQIISILHWECVVGYAIGKSRNSARTALRGLVYEGSKLGLKLGLSLPDTCDFMTQDRIAELQSFAKPFSKPEGFEDMSREEQAKLRSDSLLQANAWKSYQAWLKANAPLHEGGKLCKCCREVAHSTLVGSVRSCNTKLSASSTAVSNVASIMRKRAVVYNKAMNNEDYKTYQTLKGKDESFWKQAEAVNEVQAMLL